MFFKKILFSLLVLSHSLMLTGCIFAPKNQVLYFPIEKQNKIGLIDNEIERWILSSDRKRIQLFIATAEPTAVLEWSTRLTQYRLESHSIFVDDLGNPCRCYTLERKPLLGKVYKTREIAYRDTDAKWKRKQSVALPLHSFSIKSIIHEN